MSDNKKMDFSGEGFSKDPFSPDELAQHRERAHHYDRHFLSVDAFLEATGLKWVSQIGKSAPAFLKVAGTITAIGGAFIMLKQLGVL